MSITFERDGSVTLRDDADPSRTATIPTGAPDRDAQIAAFVGPPPTPDGPTLGDWRVGLALWGRLSDVSDKVQAAAAAGVPLGLIAKERLEYSNQVFLADLLVLKDAVGFTTDEVHESLWRADRVRQGDFRGLWPLPA